MKNLILICFILLGLSACEDAFTTTLNVDPPEHTPQMAVHAYLMDDYEAIGISVAKTYGILETPQQYEDQFLEGATVEIFQQGNLLHTIPALSETLPIGSNLLPLNYGIELEAPLGGLGDSFELKVTHPDYGSLRAVQYMPRNAVALTSAKFDTDGGLDGETGERINAIDIKFTDEAGVENYYEIVIAHIEESGGDVYYNNLYTMTIDPNVVSGYRQSQLVSDQTFDGKEYTVNLDLYEEYTENLFVIFRTVTKDWYLFSKSLNDFGEADDIGFFSEPVTVHSNMEGGLGVFAAGTEVVVPLLE